MVAATQLPFAQANPLQIAPRLRELQSEGVIHRVHTQVGDPAWLVTRYRDVRQLLDDDRLGRAHPNPESAPRSNESAMFGGPVGDFTTERTDHGWMRVLLQPLFAPKHMRTLRPRVEAIAAGLLDDLATADQPADLHAIVSAPMPVLVISELLGVPYEDREQFCGWTADAAYTRDRARSEKGLAELFTYGNRLVEAKRRDPGDDVISRMCETEGVPDYAIAALSMSLLFAGHETTESQIDLTATLLLAEPRRWQALVDQPELVPNAIEETLRAGRRGGNQMLRYARTDFEFGGVTIKAGDLLLLELGGANHDPEVFDSPEEVDVHRKSGAHVAFGYGARYCLGAPLARIELAAVFSQLVARFPALRLAVDVDELTVRSDTLGGGLSELPVRWR